MNEDDCGRYGEEVSLLKNSADIRFLSRDVSDDHLPPRMPDGRRSESSDGADPIEGHKLGWPLPKMLEPWYIP